MVEIVTREQGIALFDDACRRNLGVPADEFLLRYDDGTAREFWDDEDIDSMLMLLPFARSVDSWT